MSSRPTSNPPEAKTATAQGHAVAHAIGAVAEIVGMICLTVVFFGTDKLGQTEYLAGRGYCLGGTFVGRVTGRAPVSATVVLIGITPWLLKKIALAKIGMS